MKWLVFSLFILVLITIAVLLYKVVPQIFSYKTNNVMESRGPRRWCELHNQFYFDPQVCPRCTYFENIELTDPGRQPIFPGEDTRHRRTFND